MTIEQILDDCERLYREYQNVPRWRLLKRHFACNRWLHKVAEMERRQMQDLQEAGNGKAARA
jgi:proline dehydrogenase